MTKLAHLGDRMLGLLLREERAGACVPENGQACSVCVKVDGYCSGGYWYWRYRKAHYNCNGVCVSDSSKALCYSQRSQNIC
ncbi:hypothetical protein [Hamadaea tsunoensis]|uniref:hypothetical protein n=1 Tax=Hamadaea tsunoensis TaxID=53368 RepID=UPI000403CEF4|nr:hypothetical protein [Hamadaea tsunoensis]